MVALTGSWRAYVDGAVAVVDDGLLVLDDLRLSHQ